MKILVTGASGFTGSFTVPKLLEQNFKVTCFVRETSDLSYLPIDRVKVVRGDLSNKTDLLNALKEVEVLLNIASLGFGHAENIIEAAVESRINRAVFFSTTSIYTTLNPESKSVRLEAEKAIVNSGLVFTIIRPTMIYGSSRDRNICKFIRFINRWSVYPVFGSGEYKIQPVHVQDLADSVVKILESENTKGKAYNLSGGTVLTQNHLVDLIAEILDKKILKFHILPAPVIQLLKILEYFHISLPIKSEQIQRLNEDKVFDNSLAQDDFSYNPRPFVEGLLDEIRELVPDLNAWKIQS